MRLVGLDLLRCLAIVLVLGHHPPGGYGRVLQHPLFVPWFRIGWTGVDLFFVLSGFLIGGLLFDEAKRTGRLRVLRFFGRRAFKIWPPYAVFLIAVAALLLWDRLPLSPLGPNLLHIQNYFPMEFGWWGHTWSLAVEEHFYLLLPLLLLTLGPTRYHWLPAVFVFVAIACLVLRIVTAYAFPEEGAHIHAWPTHLRIDSLLAGVVLAWAWLHSPWLVGFAQRRWYVLVVVAALCFVPVCLADVHNTPFLYTWGFALVWITSACMVMLARVFEEHPWMQSRLARSLAWVGTISYGVYLWHMPFAYRTVEALGRRVPLPYSLLVVAYAAIAVFFGWVLTALVEWPALRIRKRLLP
jgi:peptidoglycan/LPS O-acetylase OafA/YrhL